jgi:hydrocephalus-inducing protein
MSSRVAPGMEVSYTVRFSPEAKIDYSFDLTVVTERERFIVPIRAVGCKALLDFPDVLNFGSVPVKHT